MKKTERQRHIKNWHKSGQTKKAYSDLVGIKYATFISWFKKSEKKETGRFLKLEQLETPEESKRSIGFEISFPNGIRIYSQDGLSLDLLKTLQNV